MDIRGFQVWLSAARGLTRAQRREALAVLSGRSEGEHRRQRSSCVWTRPGAVRTARARGRFRAVWRGVCGATSARLRQDLQRADRYAAVGPAPQGTLAVVRGVAGEGGDGEGVGGALRRGSEHGVPLASPVSGGGAERFGGTQGDRGSGRDLRPGEPEGCARAGTQGTAAGRQGEERGLSREQVPVLMAADRSGTTVSAVLPRVDAAALTAALDPVVAKDALLVSDGGASYPPCAAALGVSHEALNRSMGERVRGDLHVQTVNSRHSRLKDFLRPRRGIATRYLDNYLSLVPPRRPRPRRQRSGLPRRRRDEVTHTIRELSYPLAQFANRMYL